MKKNVLWWDRLPRFVCGVFSLAWAIAGGPFWAYAGLYLLATASWGYDPVYSLIDYQPFEDQ